MHALSHKLPRQVSVSLWASGSLLKNEGVLCSFLVLQFYDCSIFGTKHVQPVLCCHQLYTRHCLLPLHQLHFCRCPRMCWGFSGHSHGCCGTGIDRSWLMLAWRVPFPTPHWFTLAARHLPWWKYLYHYQPGLTCPTFSPLRINSFPKAFFFSPKIK